MNLAISLRDKEDIDGAIEAFREAVRLEPETTRYKNDLALLLRDKGEKQEAIALLREAIRLDPDEASFHGNLGTSLSNLEDYAGAIVSHQEAIRLEPEDPSWRFNLGLTLRDKGDPKGAVAAFEEVLRLDPAWADEHHTHFWLGLSQVALGDAKGAVVSLKKAARLSSSRGMTGAQECHKMKLYAAAARVWKVVFEEDSSLAKDVGCGCVYNAACAALLAAAGDGADTSSLDQEERDAWRRQALPWLEASLALIKPRLRTGDAKAKEGARKELAHWKEDPDLSSIRDPAALEALPDAERSSWEELWRKVDELLEK